MKILDGFILTRHYDKNVGASELIANGIVEFVSAPGVGVERIKADAAVLNDHSRLPTDPAVYAMATAQ